MISPLGKTTVKPEITVLIVPYFTAIVPEADVDAIPPSAASAPGSIGKKTPSSLKYSFNCFLVTLAWTLQSKSSAFLQELLGHSNIDTTTVYTHVAKNTTLSIESPLDRAVRDQLAQKLDLSENENELPP